MRGIASKVHFFLYFPTRSVNNRAMKAKRKHGAFTLVEVLIAIGVVSVLGGTGYVATQGLKQTSDENKLEQDVAQLNNAIQLYQLQSSNPLAANAQDVLLQLQTRADSASASQTTGLKSSVLDERVEAPQNDPETWQSSGEAAAGKLRAYWDANNKVFYTARTGAAGIKKFRFKGSIPTVAATESRTPLHASTASGWVWANSAAYANNSTANAVDPGTGSVVAGASSIPGSQGFPGGYWTVGPSGIVPVTYVYREAGYSSNLALFSLAGMGPDVYDLNTPEGQRQFLMEAIRRVTSGTGQGQMIVAAGTEKSLGQSGQITTATTVASFTPGDTVAAIMIPNGSMQSALTALTNLGTLAASSTALKNLSTANGQLFPLTSLSRTNTATGTNTQFPFYSSQYASLGTGTSAYAIEDTANSGDQDYQDLVFKATGLTAPPGSDTNTIDPLAYYSHWYNPNTKTYQNILDVVGTNGGMTLRQALTAAGVIQ